MCDFSSLAKHLQNLIIAEWEGRKGLMRFYDTRVFPALATSVLTEQQKIIFYILRNYGAGVIAMGNPSGFGVKTVNMTLARRHY